jgi:hypothetical protein
MQLIATKSGIPLLQVAQSVDVSKVMSYIKVRSLILSQKKGNRGLLFLHLSGASLR